MAGPAGAHRARALNPVTAGIDRACGGDIQRVRIDLGADAELACQGMQGREIAGGAQTHHGCDGGGGRQ